MTWPQNYDPFGNWVLSTLVAAVPVLTLFFVLVVLKARVWVAAFSGMVAAILLANLVFGMPATLVAAAAGHGWIFGMLRIGWIIIASIFLYNIAVETGQFQVMKDSIAGLSGDKRLQLILIAFCFGAFLEGTGGGGAPVAVTGAFLIGLGFNPFQAAVLCLVANTAPVAWGGIGNPIRTLAGVTGLPEMQFSAMTGRILPPLAFILPLWLVRSMVGWKQTFEVWPALFVSGFSFALMQYYWSNHQEVGLVDIVSAIFSLLATVALLKFWRPATIMPVSENMPERARHHNVAGVLKGWSPFIIASVLIFIASWPLFQPYITFPELRFPMPALHNAVLKMPPVAPKPTPEDATVNLNLLNLPGTPVFVGGLIAALVAGLSIGRTMAIFGRTLVGMMPALAAVSCMVALAYVTRYSGMDVVLGLTVTSSGWFYPFFGTLLGWLGVALTGTDAGSNALFGNLQKVTAEQLNLSPILMGAANSAGGVMGKMIDAQSIVVASAATQQVGNEAAIFKAVWWQSIVLASLVGLIVMCYAYLFPWLIPG
jgi:lactate permease